MSNAQSVIFWDIYLTKWDEPTGVWTYIVPGNVSLPPMEGFGAWSADFYLGSTTVQYEGLVNTGDYSSQILTSLGPNGAVDGTRGFNFVGNPYPSAIDWDNATGWTKTNLANAIYIWNPYAGNYGSYIGTTSVNFVTNIIPGGQGFYVHVPTDGTTGLLEVNNDARLHDTKPFFKTTNTENELISLEISSELNSYIDQAVVKFTEGATENFDPELDAYDFLSGLEEAPALYTVSMDEASYSINSYPKSEENVIIPLNCSVGVDGYYTITALDILNFVESTDILLEDKVGNLIVDLNEQSSYTFFAGVEDDPDRFNIRFMFTPSATAEISTDMGVQIYASNDIVYLKRQDVNILNGEVRIYDLLGKMILSENIEGAQQYEIMLDYEGILLVSFSDNIDKKEYRQKVHLR